MDRGIVRVKGIDINSEPYEYKKFIGYVPENLSLPEYLTLEEFLIYSGRIRDIPRDQLRERLDYYIELFELEEKRKSLLLSLSRGMRQKAAFIRSDGAVTPCQEFAYKHSLYVNMHAKIVNPVILGDSKSEGIMNIWNKEEYVAFREVREKMPKDVPWCGDCLYSMFKCFFTETNSMDCFMNKPSCSERLYSVNISQCNI